jgi:hypothetical protein
MRERGTDKSTWETNLRRLDVGIVKREKRWRGGARASQGDGAKSQLKLDL